VGGSTSSSTVINIPEKEKAIEKRTRPKRSKKASVLGLHLQERKDSTLFSPKGGEPNRFPQASTLPLCSRVVFRREGRGYSASDGESDNARGPRSTLLNSYKNYRKGKGGSQLGFMLRGGGRERKRLWKVHSSSSPCRGGSFIHAMSQRKRRRARSTSKGGREKKRGKGCKDMAATLL